MQKKQWVRWMAVAVFVALAVVIVVLVVQRRGPAPAASTPPADSAAAEQPETATTFAMDTLVDQQAYGPGARTALQAVNRYFPEYEARLSLFAEDGDIAAINAAAGGGWVTVAPETAALLRQALALSAQSEGAFAVTVAPLTLAWGITGDAPQVPAPEEITRLLPLVDDTAVELDGDRVRLPKAGMALDLGGIAKGAACNDAAAIYAEHGVDSALLSIGGNIYARGQKPDGSPWRIAFRNPNGSGYVASFPLTDRVVAVSGGYERYFEVDGQRYIHIMDPATGSPAQSDIASVGVICADGAEADFWSTTLFVWGRQRALAQMEAGLCAILLDNDGTLYVSESLRDGFEVYDGAAVAEVVYVPGA